MSECACVRVYVCVSPRARARASVSESVGARAPVLWFVSFCACLERRKASFWKCLNSRQSCGYFSTLLVNCKHSFVVILFILATGAANAYLNSTIQNMCYMSV